MHLAVFRSRLLCSFSCPVKVPTVLIRLTFVQPNSQLAFLLPALDRPTQNLAPQFVAANNHHFSSISPLLRLVTNLLQVILDFAKSKDKQSINWRSYMEVFAYIFLSG